MRGLIVVVALMLSACSTEAKNRDSRIVNSNPESSCSAYMSQASAKVQSVAEAAAIGLKASAGLRKQCLAEAK